MRLLRTGMSWVVLALFFASVPFTASAATYGTKDAQYVTNSRSDAVLRYIVCLELIAGTLPSSMSLESRLKRGEADCKSAAARLPKSAREHDMADIRGMILECGFNPGDGSAGADCGSSQAATGHGAPVRNPGNGVAQRPNNRGTTRSGNPRSPGPQTIAADSVNLAPRVIELGKWLEGITHDGSSLWATESGQRTIAKVDYRTGRVIERRKVGRLPIDIAAIGNDIFTLVATDKVVLKHDRRGKQSRAARLTDCPTTMAASGTDLFVLGEPDCSSATSRITRIDTRNDQLRSSADLGRSAQAMTVTDGEVWVGHSQGTAISIINKSSLQTEKMKLSSIEIWAMASNSNAVFAGGRYANSDHGGSIVMIDSRTLRERVRFSVDERVAEMVADDSKIVAIGSEGTIWILSARDLTLLRTIRLNSGKYDPKSVAFVKNDLIISAGQYRGQNGAVLVLSNYLPRGNATAGARPQRPIRPTTIGQRPGNKPTPPIARPQRPGTSSTAGFPLSARTLKPGNVRSQPSLKAAIVAKTTGVGQPLTLLARTGNLLANYPWFSIRLGNGKKGYQWGGLICSTGKPISGTKGACPIIQRPQPGTVAQGGGRIKGGSNSNQTNGADIAVGILNLFGAIIDSRSNNNNNNTNASSGQNLFTETLQVRAGDGPVSRVRKLNPDQVAIYTVRGKKGQKLRAELWSQKQNSIFNIYIRKAVENGATLPGADDGDYATYFEGALPSNGNYQIVVGSTGGRTSYELVVTLEDARNKYQASNSAAASNSLLVVGTYTSRTAGSGNIEFNKAANKLTWTEFCGPAITLRPNWEKSRLRPRGSGLGPFRLNIKNGEVLGFRSHQNTYDKEQGIMMPSCAPPPPAQAQAGSNKAPPAAQWTLNPKDPRASKDYGAVANAYWQICETANYDPKSPAFNNEKAYWNCADKGLADASAANAVGQSITTDPRDGKDYSNVANAKQLQCGTDFPDSPKDDKAYYDCMDQGLKNAAAAAGKGGSKTVVDWTLSPQDTRAGNDYSALADAAWQTCEAANANVKSATFNNEKTFWDCADLGLAAVVAQPVVPDPVTPAATPASDPRVSNDYGIVPPARERVCDTGFPNRPKDEKGYFDCMDQAEMDTLEELEDGGATTPAGPAKAVDWSLSPQDSRASTDYSTVPDAAWAACGAANNDPKSAAFNNEKAFWDCADLGLASVTNNPTKPVAPVAPVDQTAPQPDARASKDYSPVAEAKQQQCAVDNPDSPKDDKGYYDCMDEGLNQAAANDTGSAPADPVAPVAPVDQTAPEPDERASNDYSSVAEAKQQQCATDNPDSPKDDKGYYDCMDEGLNQAAANDNDSAPADPVAPVAPVDQTAPEPDERASNDYSSVAEAKQQQCAIDNPDSPKDDKGYYDCMDEGLNQAAANDNGSAPADPVAPVAPVDQTAPEPDERASNDYSSVAEAKQQQCATDNPDSPKDDKGYYDCMDEGLNQVPANDNASDTGTGAQDQSQSESDGGESSGFDLAAIDARVSSEFSDLNGEQVESCAANGYGSDNFFSCLSAARARMAAQEREVQNGDATSAEGDSGENDSQQILEQIYAYCSQTHSDSADQCYQAIGQCTIDHQDPESSEFDQCAEATGWYTAE